MKKWYMADKTASTKAMEELYDNDLRFYQDEYSKYFTVGVNKFFLNLMKKEKTRDRIMGMSEKVLPGVYSLIASRAKYLDDLLRKCLSDGTAQVVNLGSGFDTRIFRIPEIADTPYFMMDFPEVMQEFKIRSENNNLIVPENLTLVPIDFNKTSIENALCDTGFDKNKKTFFIWEGVTQYIDENAINSTLDFVGRTCTNSKIAFTYVLKDIIENPEHFAKSKKIMGMTKKMSTPWIYGFDPEKIGEYVSGYNLELVCDVGFEYYEKEYPVIKRRNLEIADIERIAVAKVK